MGVWLYNMVQINIKRLEKYKPYEKEFKSFLIGHVFYSVEEFLCQWFDAIADWTKQNDNDILCYTYTNC
jgi:hypothetical protein